MTKLIMRFGIGLVALASIAGCRKSAEEQEREARAARERATEIERKATEEVARTEAEGIRATREAKERANEEATEAAEALGRELVELRVRFAKDLDRIESRMGALREDIAADKDAAKRAETERKLDALETSVSDERERLRGAEASTAAELDGLQKATNARLGELRGQVSDIEELVHPTGLPDPGTTPYPRMP